MTPIEPLQAAKQGVELVGDIIKAAGDNPNVKAAGNELGKTALTVTKLVNNALLPIAAINFGFDKARAYFGGKFESDMAERASQIPPEHVIEPKVSIAGPALQGLAFSHEEPDLKNMYLDLLASAMDDRRANGAHPAFVEIIRQLTSEEAQLLRLLLFSSHPMVEVRLVRANSKGWITLRRHLLDLRHRVSDQPIQIASLEAYVDNWERLGLVHVAYDKHLNPTDLYKNFDERPEVHQFRKRREQGATVEIARGILAPTALGTKFANVVGLVPQ